jgi:hypothetical protein
MEGPRSNSRLFSVMTHGSWPHATGQSLAIRLLPQIREESRRVNHPALFPCRLPGRAQYGSLLLIPLPREPQVAESVLSPDNGKAAGAKEQVRSNGGSAVPAR